MALAITAVSGGQQSSIAPGATNWTTSAFTPSAKRLLVVLQSTESFNSTHEGSDLTISDSDSGITSWTAIATTSTHPGWGYGQRVWVSDQAASGSSMTLTLGASGHNIRNYYLAVYELTDYNGAGTAAYATDADGDGALTVTLGASPASTSIVLAGVSVMLNSGTTTVTPGSGWTEDSGTDRNDSDWTTVQIQRRGSSTSTSVDWDDINDAAVSAAGANAWAVEILDAAVSPPVFTAQPTEQTAADGATATFTTTVTGATSYQWETKATGGGAWGNVSGGSGGTTDDYTTGTLSRSTDAGRLYRLKATNASGDTYSNEVLLRVTQIPTSYASAVGLVVGSSLSFVGASYVGATDSDGISGAGAITLGALTLSAAGTLPIVGASSLTLGDLALSATGALPIVGASAVTFSALTVSAAGALPLAGAASLTLGTLALSSAGALPLAGAAAITLEAVTTIAAGTLPLVGAASITLANLTTTAASTLALAGAAATTFDALTLSAAGNGGVNGAAAVTLANLTSSAAGTLNLAAAAAITLAAVTTTAAGSLPIVGAASIALGDMTATAAGTVALAGTASMSLGALTLAAEGVLTAEGSGAAAITLAAATVSAAGTLPIAGAASVTLGALTTTATGTAAIAGVLGITLGDLVVTGFGAPPRVGEAAIALADVVATAEGEAGSEAVYSTARSSPGAPARRPAQISSGTRPAQRGGRRAAQVSTRYRP